MTTAIILILLLVLFMLWSRIMSWLQPYIQRWMARRIEKFVRNAAGMPPPPKQKKSRARRENAGHSAPQGDAYRSRAGYRDRQDDEPVIPREYAEDVEFTETVDYSEDRFTDRDGREHTSTRIRTESQVSDAEWEEIKGK